MRFTGIRYSDGRAGGIALDNLALVQGAANPATWFTDSGPAAQGSHSYQVSAYDVAGNESAVAGPVTGTTLPDTAAPSVPGDLAVSGVTSSSISLSWRASTDAGGSGVAGYRIYRDGSATPLASVTGTTFTDAGLRRREPQLSGVGL